MLSMPDVATLSLCSMLASTAFMVVYLALWRIRTGQAFLLDWAGSSGVYAATLVSFALFGDRPMVTAFLYALLGLCNVLILSGVRRFDDVSPFRPWMLLLVLLPSLLYLGPALLRSATAAQIGGLLGLAADMLVVGTILIRGRSSSQPFGQPRGNVAAGGRRIAGWALLGYIPAYLVTVGLLASHDAVPRLAALIPLLSDQLLLGVLNLGLIAMPGERAQAALRRIALRDTLTGALNRAGLTAEAPPFVTPGTAIVAIDIDHFKAINDRYGHAAGDAVLVALATCALETCARRRVSHRNLVVRLGGDEFVVVLADTPREAALAFTRDLRRALGAMPNLPPWTASMGVSTMAPGETDLLPALARADRALYDAKALGRDRAAA